MGSSSSKPHSASSTSSSSVHRAHRVFHSSCLRPPSGSHHSDSDNDSDDHPVSDHQNKENGCNGPCTDQNETESDQLKSGCFRKVKVEQSDEMPSISSNVGLQEWDQANFTRTSSRAGSSSTRASSTQSLNPSSRFLSRFSLIPGNISFRLSRASSLGSSRAYPVSSSSITSNSGEELHLRTGPSSSLVNRNGTQQGSDLLPVCLINRSPTSYYEDSSANRRLDPPSSVFSDNMRENPTITTHDVNLHSTSGHAEIESMETRLADRRIGPREPVERNVRFSRTLSVGRLRDRVLRRSSFSDLTFCPLRREREARDMSEGSERQVLDNETRASATDRNVATSPTSSGYPLSSMSSSLFGSQDFEMETSRSREARYHDLLEHRSNFLERRRRIRSQVRALQRLGSRFENLSGHERSCILSGQHRTGRCTCRVNTRDANSNDDTSARASISRIVMLAEALFEVLDEIHQQSVVLSSRPSVSSIGSVPAPNEVVESLPLKLYDKSQKHQNDEAAQCYICLVEYEEGDNMRVLPCHHEFHRTCVDKWLKEIHRVCPLCRGDICRSGSLLAEN
ncbi:hypothetical protein PVL29_002619 [Vitis rotundifolia]|uniref:RING-type domain-containing protein n=2 Tax=Vitis rotundifolia TaxID=103349 RepID=A0AA39E8H1_VITRO|nr:hypothetical protein PVL29_002619 [Vitis rotundifolia]